MIFCLHTLLYLLHLCSCARLPCIMYRDVLYTDFAGAKIGENKISIRKNSLIKLKLS